MPTRAALVSLRSVLEQRLNVGGNVDVAAAQQRLCAAQAGQAREPFLDVVVEAVLRLAGLEASQGLRLIESS